MVAATTPSISPSDILARMREPIFFNAEPKGRRPVWTA
jgi:hypothetical protein